MIADRKTPDLPTTDRIALSVSEAADAIRVSSRQVYVLAEKHGLPTIKLGGRRLIRRADLEAWLAAQPVDRIGDGQDAANAPAVEANGEGVAEGARA
ncbi:MAG TPA: helix-turn-helix domain-containing protein [Phycisphaerae bacterium]|nr:helix-turn-helix domain-containing protein [Phycisphaerae bacterium]